MRKLLITISTQLAELYEDDTPLAIYPISSAKNGLGFDLGSYCTPTGRLRVAEKIGDGLPLGAIFKGRIFTGEIWTSETVTTADLILTRILWLEGAEPCNANTRERFIYLHGTNHEGLIGQSVSHGCIRFRNEDILEIFAALEVGSEVLIA